MSGVVCSRRGFEHWDDCIWLEDEHVWLVVLVSAGPRVVGFGRRGRANVLYVEPPLPESSAHASGWRLLGGHRLWTAPEDRVMTYVPDNAPVAVEVLEHGVRVVGEPEAPTGIEKALEVRLVDGVVSISHQLTQRVGEAVRAPWAITALAAGGSAWLPRVKARAHPDALLPDQSLVLWPYTDLADPRLHLLSAAVRVRQDPSVAVPIKIGAHHPLGWLAWSRGDEVFIQHTLSSAEGHPDLGSSHEIYADGALIELEALGPVVHLTEGMRVVMEQRWWHQTCHGDLSAERLGRLAASLGLDAGRLV